MFKKIILASILAISTSFAAWDLFPVLENHKGQAKLRTSLATCTLHKVNYTLDMFAGVRYTVVSDLELALSVPYAVFSYAGKNIGINGFGNPELSARYQFIPTMNVFADVYFPVGDESVVDESWGFTAGLQFSTRFSPLLNFGSELGVSFETYGERRNAPLSAFVDAELDFAVTPQFTPYIVASVDVNLGGFDKIDGYEFGNADGGYTYIALGGGTKYDINQIVTLDASVWFSKLVNRIDSPVSISVSLAAFFNF